MMAKGPSHSSEALMQAEFSSWQQPTGIPPSAAMMLRVMAQDSQDV